MEGTEKNKSPLKTNWTKTKQGWGGTPHLP